jgi:hypothetical protein
MPMAMHRRSGPVADRRPSITRAVALVCLVAATFAMVDGPAAAQDEVPGSPPETPVGTYVSLPASRIVDTANGIGTCNEGPCAQLLRNTTTTIQVTGEGTVPTAGVDAVALNLTVVGNQWASGLIQINPQGATAAATLSYSLPHQKNTFAIVPVDAAGRIVIANTHQIQYAPLVSDVHITIDVSGYLSTTGGGATYTSLPPRITVNTAVGTGICDGAPCQPSTGPSIRQIKIAGRIGVPATGVVAVALRVSVANPIFIYIDEFDQTPGAVTVYDSGGGIVKELHYAAGQDSTDVVIAPLNPDGTVTVGISNASQFRLDVTGYFASPTEAVPGGPLRSLPPTRLVDTYAGTGTCVPGPCTRLAYNQRITVEVAGHGGVPIDATSVMVNTTAHRSNGTGQMRLSPLETTGPGSNAHGVFRFRPSPAESTSIVPIRPDGTIELVATHNAEAIIDVIGYVGP